MAGMVGRPKTFFPSFFPGYILALPWENKQSGGKSVFLHAAIIFPRCVDEKKKSKEEHSWYGRFGGGA
jgi:hypothetical protein